MNSTFLVGYWDVLLLTSVTNVNMKTLGDEGQQEQGNDNKDDDDDDDFSRLHCVRCELLNIHIIWEVKTKPQLFVYIHRSY